MRGVADEGFGIVKVSMTGLEGPMTWEMLVMVARAILLCPLAREGKTSGDSGRTLKSGE
jgi:hypothetical protein